MWSTTAQITHILLAATVCRHHHHAFALLAALIPLPVVFMFHRLLFCYAFCGNADIYLQTGWDGFTCVGLRNGTTWAPPLLAPDYRLPAILPVDFTYLITFSTMPPLCRPSKRWNVITLGNRRFFPPVWFTCLRRKGGRGALSHGYGSVILGRVRMDTVTGSSGFVAGLCCSNACYALAYTPMLSPMLCYCSDPSANLCWHCLLNLPTIHCWRLPAVRYIVDYTDWQRPFTIQVTLYSGGGFPGTWLCSTGRSAVSRDCPAAFCLPCCNVIPDVLATRGWDGPSRMRWFSAFWFCRPGCAAAGGLHYTPLVFCCSRSPSGTLFGFACRRFSSYFGALGRHYALPTYLPVRWLPVLLVYHLDAAAWLGFLHYCGCL